MNYKWKDEYDEILKDMYENHYKTYKQIAEVIGLSPATVSLRARTMFKTGELKKHDPLFTEERLNHVKKLFDKGFTIQEMAFEMGSTPQNVNRLLNEQVERGIIPRNFAKARKERLGDGKPDGLVVVCNSRVSAACIYGTKPESHHAGLCRYIQCTNKRRGCPLKACDKFSQITPTNPRRDIQDIDYSISGIASSMERGFDYGY